MDFNLTEWRAQLAQGRFDDHLADMHTDIGLRAANGRRRWVCRWQDRTWTEDDLLLETAAEAERRAGMGWGGMNLLLQLNPTGNAQAAKAILVAIGVVELGWEAGLAERTVGQLRMGDFGQVFTWELVDEGKDQPASPAT